MSVWVLVRYAGHDELDGVVDRLLGSCELLRQLPEYVRVFFCHAQ
jgi:hypothetical protein